RRMGPKAPTTPADRSPTTLARAAPRRRLGTAPLVRIKPRRPPRTKDWRTGRAPPSTRAARRKRETIAGPTWPPSPRLLRRHPPPELLSDHLPYPRRCPAEDCNASIRTGR